jgi:hypothetical protein
MKLKRQLVVTDKSLSVVSRCNTGVSGLSNIRIFN